MNILIKNIKMLINGGTPKGDICISGNKILSAGVIPEGFAADKVIDGSDKLAIPGLINCHTHTYMSLFRNLADDLSFEDWLFGAIMPREDALSPEDAYWGAMLSCAEMIKTGTTCFMDMHMFPAMTASAADKLGMRAVMTRGLTGSDRNDKDGIRRYNEHMDERERFKGNDRITFKLGPHAIYTCGEDYLRWLIEKAHETEQEFHIHLSETTTEVQNCYKERSKSPVEYLNDIGFLDIKTCAAHCVHVSDSDMDILAEKHVSVIHNPDENLNLAFNGFYQYSTVMGSRWARVRHNGYRDLMSDSECTGSFAPKLAWERYKRVLTYQYSNGYAPRTFIDGQIRDNNFSDCAVWITFTGFAILHELGDPALLEEEAAFNDGTTATVYEHMRRSVDFLYHFQGVNGLVKIWGGDWNDCMNMAAFPTAHGLEFRI